MPGGMEGISRHETQPEIDRRCDGSGRGVWAFKTLRRGLRIGPSECAAGNSAAEVRLGLDSLEGVAGERSRHPRRFDIIAEGTGHHAVYAAAGVAIGQTGRLHHRLKLRGADVKPERPRSNGSAGGIDLDVLTEGHPGLIGKKTTFLRLKTAVSYP